MPANIALLGFFAEFCTRCLAQVGFMCQKLAHRDTEKRELLELSQGKMVAGGIDNVNGVKSYFQCKWFIGLTLIGLNTIT